MSNGREFALPISTQRHLLMRTWPRTYRTEHLRTFQDQLHRSLCLPRSEHRQYNVRPDLTLGAEASPGEKTRHLDVLFRNRKYLRQLLSDTADVLSSVMNLEPVALPLCDRRVRLHRVVMMNGRGVDLVDFHLCFRKRAVHISPTLITGLAIMLTGIRLGKSCAKIKLRRSRLVPLLHKLSGMMRLFESLRHHQSDWLIVVEDHIVLEQCQTTFWLRQPDRVRRSDYSHHAGQPFCFTCIEVHPPAGLGAHNQLCVQQSGDR